MRLSRRALAGNAWEITAAGRYRRGIGGKGAEPGQFHLPHGIAVDKTNHLYIADARNSRIQKLAMD